MRNGKVGRMMVTVGLANINSEKFTYLKALIDAGADNSVMPKKLAEDLGIKIREETWIITGNGPTKVGMADMKIILNGHFAYTTVWINEKIKRVLIGVILLEQLGLKVNPKKGILEEEEQVMYAITR